MAETVKGSNFIVEADLEGFADRIAGAEVFSCGLFGNNETMRVGQGFFGVAV